MGIVGIVLIVVGLVGVGYAVGQLIRLRGEVRRLDVELREAADRADALPPDLVAALGSGQRRVIAIELLNPFELAGRSTWFAKPLAAVTPDLLRNVVNQRAVSLFREKSVDFGVQADVTLHHAE
ncbi:MAG TPA: hypothetical protein VEX15_07920 [Nocardioidaceae bacterium]|nr:hypothetical protein [Nocardioidaceae bacterium]